MADASKLNGGHDRAPDPRLVRAENAIAATKAHVDDLEERLMVRLGNQDKSLADIHRALGEIMERLPKGKKR
jgi:hypothetical protein